MRKPSSPAPVPLTTPLLTVEDAAQVLKVSRSKMYELIHKGLPTVKIDGKRRILPAALATWIQQQAEDTTTPIPGRSVQKARSRRGKAHE